MLALLLSRAQRGAMARTDYSTRGNKDALSIQGSAVQSEVGGKDTWWPVLRCGTKSGTGTVLAIGRMAKVCNVARASDAD